MADLAQTPANVRFGSKAQFIDGTAGEAIAIGQPVYLDPVTKKYFKTDANVTLITAAALGLAATQTAGADQPLKICIYDDDCTPGLGTMVSGDALFVSANVGGIAPAADLAAGWFPTFLGIGATGGKMFLNPVRGKTVK